MYLPCHKANDQILASPRVLVKWPTMSLKIPMLSFSQCWPHLPSVTKGYSTCKCLMQTVPHSHTKRRGPLSPLHCYSLERQTFCRRPQETSHQFPWSRSGPLVVRMVGMQGSHTLSLFIEKWALPAKKGMPAGRQPATPASCLSLPPPFSQPPSRESLGLSTTFGQVLCSSWGKTEGFLLSLLSPRF